MSELGSNAKPDGLSPADLAMNEAKDKRIDNLTLVIEVLDLYAKPAAIDRIGIMSVVIARQFIEDEIRILQDSKFITLGQLAERGDIS